VFTSRTRGPDTERLEAFSDGVFAFALTLLVVSLEVPNTFAELLHTVQGFPAFAASFAILVWIWVEHYRFFRTYRLVDGWIIALNSLLLFVILFYVYPLKFMFSFLSRLYLGIGGTDGAPYDLRFEHAPLLLLIYGAGFVAVFAVLALMHWRVLRVAPRIGLDAQLRRRAALSLGSHLISVTIGVLSLLLAVTLPDRVVGLAGLMYALLGPAHALYGRWSARRLAVPVAAAESAEDYPEPLAPAEPASPSVDDPS